MSEQVRCCLRQWDKDGQGVILKDELVYVLRTLDPQTTDEELNALFSVAQIGGEDKISYERFVTWLFCDIPELWKAPKDANGKGSWELALSAARTEAAEHHPKAKVESYFSDVEARITGLAYTEVLRSALLQRCAKDTSISFDEVIDVVESAVYSSPDMTAATRPRPDDIRAAFDAHDVNPQGNGCLAIDEIVSLVRFLQIRVASATFLEAERRAAQDVKRCQADKSLRHEGLWRGAITLAKAKASQRFGESAVESYFSEVVTRLSGAEYEKHVKGEFFRKTDANTDGKVSFEEAVPLINSTLQCAADLGGADKPTPEALRQAFDAHDTVEEGLHFMGGNEFLNLMRYLQVQVAEVMLPMSKFVKEDQQQKPV